jgi:SAM-dependent methyltransferase
MEESARSSHATLLGLVGAAPRRILDVGCGQGQLGSILRERGHHVTGIDMYPPQFELDAFIEADLARGLPIPADQRFDVIVLADVLEHMAEPLPFLRAVVNHVAEGGTVLVSLPNAVHWSVRGQVALGRFEYTNKGLLDRGHLRFFTLASAKRLFEGAGLSVRTECTTPVPWENVFPAALRRTLARGVENIDHTLGAVWPNLFAYQHVFELQRAHRAER